MMDISKYGGRIKTDVAHQWDRYYPNYDHHRFEKMIDSIVEQDWNVLEIGAGSGRGDQHHFNLKGRVAKYVGIDLDERVLENPHLDEAKIGDAADLPFEDETFDFIFHVMVAEHLQNPKAALAESARVLKQGGCLIFKTPSKWYYPMLLARMTPHWFHEFYINRFASGRQSKDVFPTVYKLNDRTSVKKLCRNVGLNTEIDFWHSPPGYLRFHHLAFKLGVAYERSIERLWAPLAALMIVKAKKI